MNMIDCYHILGIPVTADDDEIRKSYRRLAVVYHPDKNPNNPEAERKFREVSEAYNMLRNRNASTAASGGGDIVTTFCGVFVGFYEGFFGAIER